MAMKYMGGGFIQGVPARDLSDEEERRYGALVRDQQQLTGVVLYVEVRPPRKSEKSAAGGE